MIDPLFAQLAEYLDQAAPHHLDPAGQLQCGSCQGRWRIVDPPRNRTWHCPWCGFYSRTADTPTTQEDLTDG